MRERTYHFNDEWSYQEQWDWLDNKQVNDQYWADTESMIRREAVRIQSELRATDRAQIVDTTIIRPSASGDLGRTYVRVSFMLARVGGMEELLLIEENLRRALGAK
jgi:hypothetical protein